MFRIPPGIRIALVAVVVVAAAFAIASMRRDGKITHSPSAMHFQCAQCGHHFELAQEALPAGYRERMMESGSSPPVDCPQCGAKQSAYAELKCPSCGYGYISEYSFPGGVVPSGVKAFKTCPKCGADPTRYRSR
jgi:rubredoxin